MTAPALMAFWVVGVALVGAIAYAGDGLREIAKALHRIADR